MANLKIGIISPNDKRPWCVSANSRPIVQKENELAEVLKQNGCDVLHGYGACYAEPYPGVEYNGEKFGQVPQNDIGKKLRPKDKTAWRTGLVRLQVQYLLKNGADVILVHQGDWTFPTRTVEIFTEAKRLAGAENPPIVMFSYHDSRVPGLVAGMAARGSLLRIGKHIAHVFGKPAEEKTVKLLIRELRRTAGRYAEINSIKTRYDFGPSAEQREFLREVDLHREWAKWLVAQELPKHKYLAFGGMALDMTTTTADIDQWRTLFGLSYAHLDQVLVDRKADRMVQWSGAVGESDYAILDWRVEEAVRVIFAKHNFSFAKDRPALERKIVLQVASFYAMRDLFDEEEATFGGIKCQDEESALRCTQCIAAAYLNNNLGPAGEPNKIIPFACENDMDSSLTQLIMFLATGKPAGFGDFRDVEYENGFADKRARLLIVNCGQHPPYYFDGAPEHLEQEHFYAKGGASVRGRTPPGKTLTVARLARVGLRYTLVATVIETEGVRLKDHAKHNLSWPIIRGILPERLGAEKIIDMWPCNHLGFAEGDVTAKLMALAEELNIGYRIVDAKGFEYLKQPHP